RLGMLSLVFSAAIALLLWLFVSDALSQRAFSQKEVAGAAYAAEIWKAIRTGGSLDDQGARFAATAAYQAFGKASPGPRRASAGADLIGAIADGSNLTLDPDLDSFYVMD